MSLRVLAAGPAMTVQDFGRPGRLAMGLSRGGAMDRAALSEAAALLGQSRELAVLEMAGTGGRFLAEADLRIALTGAPMRATLGDQPLEWHASHAMPAGTELAIGPALAGSYGYLAVGGGLATPSRIGSRAAHLSIGLGGLVATGDRLPCGDDPGGPVGLRLEPEPRFQGGDIRILPSAQSDLFAEETRARLVATPFRRDARSNRQAVRLAFEGDNGSSDGGGDGGRDRALGFAAEGGLSVLSEPTMPGDIQITGDGVPVVLGAEAQTSGGYPRIATVLPADLPRLVQAPVGAALRLHWITPEAALAAERAAASQKPRPRPVLRDPRDMPDLLSYSLIDGMITGREEDG